MNELEVSRVALLRVLQARPVRECGAPSIADDCNYTSELGSDLTPPRTCTCCAGCRRVCYADV